MAPAKTLNCQLGIEGTNIRVQPDMTEVISLIEAPAEVSEN